MNIISEDVKKQMEERELVVQHFMSFKTRTTIEGETERLRDGVMCALNFVVKEAYDILSHVSLERINFELEQYTIDSVQVTEMEIIPTDPNKGTWSTNFEDVQFVETQHDWVSIFNIFYNSTMQELRDFSFKYYDGQDSGPVLIIPHSEYLDTLKKSYYAENNVDDVFHDLKEHWNKSSIWKLVDKLQTITTRDFNK